MPWKTLTHYGPAIPQPYKPLPRDIFVEYKDGTKLALSTSEDNVLGISAQEAMVLFVEKGGIFNKSEEYIKSFLFDWNLTLKTLIDMDTVKKLNFTKVAEYMKQPQPLPWIPEVREKQETSIFGYASFDKKRLQLSGWKVPPPKILKSGRLRPRITPKDVVINASCEPIAWYRGKECDWKEVIKNKNISWTASWKMGNRIYYTSLVDDIYTKKLAEKFYIKVRKLNEIAAKCVLEITNDDKLKIDGKISPLKDVRATLKVLKSFVTSLKLYKDLEKTPDENKLLHFWKSITNADPVIAHNLISQLKTLKIYDENLTHAEKKYNRRIERTLKKVLQADIEDRTFTARVDPRIIVAWCKRQEVPIQDVWSEEELMKNSWTLDTSIEWKYDQDEKSN